MSTRMITRTIDTRLESRSGAASGDGLTLSGYAATFDDVTHIRSWEGEFDEQIAPGAFAETLTERTPILQWNHGRDSAIGQTPIGVFTDLTEDRVGLKVTARLHDNWLTLPVRDAISSGAVTGMSFKFEVTGDYWRAEGKLITPREASDLMWSGGTPVERTITSVKLYEAGPVSTPAYPNTSVGLRTGTHSSESDAEALRLLILKGQLR